MAGMFKPATREKLKLRMALCGPSGSGKSFTALRLAFGLAAAIGNGAKVAAIDTEHRSLSKEKGKAPDGVPWEFDVCELENFAPTTYTQVIREAGRLGFAVLVIDGLSQAWEGHGGALELVDRKAGEQGKNKFTAWGDVTPMHREMIEAILSSPCHIIATMRTKMEYVLEEEVRPGGKKVMVPKKVGMQPIQRQGMEYEFDIVGDLDLEHVLSVSKTRCSAVDGTRTVKPDANWIRPVWEWLNEGKEVREVREVAHVGSQLVPGATLLPAASAAGQVARPGLPATPSADTATTQNLNHRCLPYQVEEIKRLARELQMPPAAIKAAVEKRGVTKLAELTGEQAIVLLSNLKAKLTTKGAGAPF